MELPNRKTIEIRRKLQSLGSEFQRWKERSEAGGPLERHHTQIRRLATILEGLQEAYEGRLDRGGAAPAAAPASPQSVLAACRTMERTILELHRIWDFFRSKLILRDVVHFCDILLVADELAWACYEPALKRAGGTPAREPPLVFFNGESSPFVMPRRSSFESEAASLSGERFYTPAFRKALAALPIPVIGIPWLQAEFLPELLVVAHEVGHAVEDDFGLGTTLGRLLDTAMATHGVSPARQAAWRAWLGEIFADLWGNLAAGPAFAGALADFLARDPRLVASERRASPSWGSHPTDTLRVLLSAMALERTGFAAEAESLRQGWTTVYSGYAMSTFEADLPVVVDALLGGPYPEFGGVRLDAVLSFSAENHRYATVAASQALQRQRIDARDSRVLAAAARLAFEREPQRYADGDAQSRLVERVKEAQVGGVRGRRHWRDPKEMNRLDAEDRETAQRLHRILADRQDDGIFDDRAGP